MWIMIGQEAGKVSSDRKVISQGVWVVAWLAAMYLASIVNKATDACFLELHVIGALASWDTIPDMDF